MKHSSPPKLALKLLNHLLPNSVKDDITGDLTEEFNQTTKTSFVNQVWFWQQTLSTCYRYNMNKQNILSLLLAIATLFVFYVLIIAVTCLSYGDNPAYTQVFDKEYWTTGAIHLFFVESEFRQALTGEMWPYLNLNMLIHTPAILWTVISLSIMYLANKRYQLKATSYGLLALILIIMPYVWGVMYINLHDLPPTKLGPIVAFMWISTIYLILPFTYGLIRKIRTSSMTISA